MSESKPVRPPQVTMAGWLVVAGSVIVVLMSFSQVGDLRSLQTREAVEAYLAQPPGSSLGIGTQGALQALRITAMIAAACAAAAAILGWQVLQRSKGSRIALSVLAVPLLVTGLVTGGVASAVVVAAITMLWFQPARDWFAGRAPRPRPVLPTATAPTRDPLLDLPPPTRPPLHPTPYAAAPGPTGAATSADARPAAVRWACVLTWAFSTMAFTAVTLTLLVTLGQPDTLIDEVRGQNAELASRGVSDEFIRNSVYVTSAVLMVWSLAAIAVAVLVWRRVRWAAIALVVSAGTATGVCLLVMLGSVVMIVPLAACSATFALLLRPESRVWFVSRRQGTP